MDQSMLYTRHQTRSSWHRSRAALVLAGCIASARGMYVCYIWHLFSYIYTCTAPAKKGLRHPRERVEFSDSTQRMNQATSKVFFRYQTSRSIS